MRPGDFMRVLKRWKEAPESYDSTFTPKSTKLNTKIVFSGLYNLTVPPFQIR